MQTVSLKNQKINGIQGFSLVEIIVVMLIISVVMMAVMSLVVQTQRSSVIQSDLSTIQGGMQVALERMSKDIRNAGFLFAGSPISSAAYPVNTIPNETITISGVDGLTINTRAVSGIFGRIDSVPGTPSLPFKLIYPDQIRNFPVGSYAAVVEPVNGILLGDGSVTGNIYRVIGSAIAGDGSGTVKLGKHNGTSDLDSISPFVGAASGLVLLRVPTAAVSSVVDDATAAAALNRTITYSHIDTDGDGNPDTLTRQVDAGPVSHMARGISALAFTLEEDGDGDVNKVTIDLTGEAEAIGAGNDAVSSAKTKRVRILIALRNV